jgi:hypothetical protein
MKTQEIIDNKDGTIAPHTVDEATVATTPEEVAALDEAKAREILYLENDIRVLQARLADLQGEKAKTCDLSTRAREIVPVKEVEPLEVNPLEGGAVLKGR